MPTSRTPLRLLALFGFAAAPVWSQEPAMPTFLPPESPLLQQPARPVPPEAIGSAPVEQAIAALFRVAAGQRRPGNMQLVGLAAPQIGIDLAIILVDTSVREDRTGWGELEVYLNPVVIWQSVERELGREGCFSVDRRVSGIVERPTSIRVSAVDRSGQPLELALSGFTARIFQHEIDHLDGVRFPDRVGPDGVLHWVPAEQAGRYRAHWRQWPWRFPWRSWQAMKQGLPYEAPKPAD